jgi:hypothetical protein
LLNYGRTSKKFLQGTPNSPKTIFSVGIEIDRARQDAESCPLRDHHSKPIYQD